MKKYSSYFKLLFIALSAFLMTGCVHDDKYDDPDLGTFQCQDLNATLTIAEVKALHGTTRYLFPQNSDAVMEGYVSSTDQSGNIYKTIYIQDDPVNPTHGFTISVDAVSTYTQFPQGSKIYIKLNGLALGTYGGLVQLGIEDESATTTGPDAVSRIPEKMVAQKIFRSCKERAEIIPKKLKISEMTANQNLLGALVELEDVEFTNRALCSSFAPDGVTVDRQIGQGWNAANKQYLATAVIRNSGFAGFANQPLPAGNGNFIGIFSRFNSTYQLYINKLDDLSDMKNFPRLDGITADPCAINEADYTLKTVSEVKQLLPTNTLTQINGNLLLKAKVTANDETGNLYKYIYVEDATGGIRININKLNLYQDARFKVGKEIYIKLNELYIGRVNGEVQLGQPFNNNVGQIAENDVYKFFFDGKKPVTPVVATERKISELTTDDVGRWIKLKGLQFIEDDLGKPFAAGSPTNRTLEDCEGNTIILRTSNFASFAGAEIDGGKGDVYAILSIFNGTYQLWIPKQVHADLDNPRCDGTVPLSYDVIFSDGFDTLAEWTAVNVTGAQVWGIATFGNPRPSAIMDGNRQQNEDWLVSKKISLANWTDAFVSFETDGRYSGNPMELYITENYTGAVATTTWVKLDAGFDTDLNAFGGFVSSGRINLKNYLNKEVVFAFKYTSAQGASTTWEVDNFAVKGAK